MGKFLRPDTYARSTLERYTGSDIKEFCSYILLVNFQRYTDHFANLTGQEIKSGYWEVVHDPKRDVSIINFGVGSPSAGIIAHCLSYLDQVKAVLMLGMCGGIDDELEIGDILIPTASVRDEGTSKHYLQPNVPAQPSFWINQVCEKVAKDDFNIIPKSGIMLTTDYRMWEFDQDFVKYILEHRILAIDMEIATLFSVAYALKLPIGSIMLISDLPMMKGGIKSKESASKVFDKYTDLHFDIGLKAIEKIQIENSIGKSCQLKNEW